MWQAVNPCYDNCLKVTCRHAQTIGDKNENRVQITFAYFLFTNSRSVA